MPLHQLRLFSGIYLFSKESRIQYSYLAHDENPIQFVHPFIFILIGIAVALINGYISFSHVFTADLLSICMCAFLTGLTWLTASIQPFLPDIMQWITIDLAVDHVDVADIMEPEPV